jgi:hypothetical protein
MATDSQQLREVFRSTISNSGTPFIRDIWPQVSSFCTLYVRSTPTLHRFTGGGGGEGGEGASSCCNHTTSKVIVVTRQPSTPSAPAGDEAPRQLQVGAFLHHSATVAQHAGHAPLRRERQLLHRSEQSSVSIEIRLLVETLSRWSKTCDEFANGSASALARGIARCLSIGGSRGSERGVNNPSSHSCCSTLAQISSLSRRMHSPRC